MRVRRALTPWLMALGVLVVSAAPLFRGQVQAWRDLYAHDFPDTFYLVARWSQGQVPWWLPNARLGQPFAALLYTQVFYPPRVLTGLIFGHVLGPNVMHVLHGAFAYTGAWLAARRFGLLRWSRFVAAAPFALAPFFVESAQNLSFASTTAWMPWTLLAAELLRRRVSLGAIAQLGATLGAAFFAGAPEIWLTQVMLAVLVLAFASPKAWLAGGVALVLAMFACGVVALPAAELAREFTLPGSVPEGRLEWSVSFVQLLSLAVPDADLPRAGEYWGSADQHFYFTLFVGSAVCVLAPLAVRRRRARPLALFTALCLLLCLGKNFVGSEWLLELPPFRFFRYPAKYAAGLSLGLSLLGGMGAQRLMALGSTRARTYLAAALGLVAGLSVAALTLEVRSGFHEGIRWAAMATTAVAGVALLRRRRVLPWLAALVAVELVAAPHQRWERLPVAALTTPSPLTGLLPKSGRVSIRVDMDDTSPAWCIAEEDDAGSRIVLQSRQRLSALRFIEEGLHATGGYGFRDPWRLSRAFRAGAAPFSMSGVASFVRNAGDPLSFQGPTPEPTPISDVWIWRTPLRFPRSWIVETAHVAADDEAFNALTRPVETFRHEVWVSEGPARASAPCDSTVGTSERDPEHLDQHASACADGYLVLADAWYPGWRVSIDGAEVTPVRANGFLRAVPISKGVHELRWRYEPSSIRLGIASSLAGWGSLLGLALFAMIRRRKHLGPAIP